MSSRKLIHLKPIAIWFALTALTFTVAIACGDDSDDDATGSPTSGTETPSQTNGTPDGETPTQDPTPTPTVDGPSPTGAAAEVRSLIRGWLDGVNGKITYRYESLFGGKPEGVYSTYFLDGASRHDWFNEGSGLGVTVTTIVDGEDAYVCTLSESNSICRATDEIEATQTRVAILIIVRTLSGIADNAGSMTIEALPDEEIAGVTASCYHVVSEERITEGREGVEDLKLCFSEAGQLLLVDHVVEFEDPDAPRNTLEFVAIEVDEPTSEDFEPPAQVFGG